MSQTQATNNYWTSNFPSGGLPNGTTARERQKEEARRQRAQQSFHTEGVVKNNHLFGEPRKVKPTEQDPLKNYIHAALGEFSGVASSIMEQQHLLLGVSRAPQTPVDGTGSFFGSNTDKSKKTNVNVNGVKDSSLKNKVSHSIDRVKESSEKSSLPTRESITKQHRHSTTPYKIPEPKDKTSKSHSSSSKKHSQSPINGLIKTECNGVTSEKNNHHAKSPSKRKEDGDRQIKNKPPKLSMPTKLSSNGLEGNEAVRVDSILKEMTQLVAPPLTGIHTPIKGSSQHGSFPFPDKPVPQVVLHDLSGKKKEKASLSEDLHLSDDDSDDEQVQHGRGSAGNPNRSIRNRSLSVSSSSSGSSEDSDSDSSDSESEAEVKEPETKNWDLASLSSAFNQRSTNGVVESPSCTTVGDDGLRGNQIAPGVHTSPDKTSQVLQDREKKSNNFLFKPIEDTSDVFSSQMPENIFGDQSPLPLERGVAKTELSFETPAETSSVVNVSSEISTRNSHQEDSQTIHSNSSNSNTNLCSSSEVSSGALNFKVSKEKEKKEKNTKTDEAKPDGKSTKKSSKLKKETIGSTSEDKKVEKTVELASTTDDNPKLNGKSGNKLKKEERTTKKRPIAKKTHSTAHDKNEDGKIDSDTVGNGDSLGEQLLTNGISKVAKVLNGSSSPLSSSVKELEIPVTHLVNGNSGLNGENQHDSLIVTIDLGLLQRIPKIPGSNGTIMAKLTTTSPVVENGRVKVKRQSSIDKNSEPVGIKKAKTGVESDSDDRRPRERTTSSSSTSSRYSTDHDVSHRKRSPSQESDRYHKRRRHASENGIDQDRKRGNSHERERIRTRDRDRDDRVRHGGSHSRDGHRDRLRDFDRPAEEPLINGYSPNSRSDRPCWCGGKKDDGQLTSYLEQLYGPNPRVPHSPDHYLQEAKKLKHKADGLSDKEKKPHGYVEAVIQFMKCGRALEQKQSESPESSSSACQMYRETRDLLSYAMRQFVSRASQQSDGSSDKRLMALCLRIQSVLHMKMYRLRKDQAQKNNRILLEYFKDKGQQPKASQAPSPYNSNPSKMTGTPSPLSPTPSPSGSIGSIGSVGSTGSQEAATPSRNGKQPSSAMASPGNACIPQKIYSLNTQHLNLTSHLVISHEKWDLAHSLVLEHKDFFIDLDKKCGPLTPSSSVVSVSNYVQEALSRLKNS